MGNRLKKSKISLKTYEKIVISKLEMPKTKFELGQARSWSKYGGSRKGFNASRDKEEWTCQVCGREQSIELPKYFIPFDGELMVMCANCKNKSIKRKKYTYFTLRTTILKTLTY